MSAANCDPSAGDTLPDGPRIALACRAAGDITEVVMVLCRAERAELNSAVLQMLQQRVYDLASGILAMLEDPRAEPADIRADLYPSEPASAATGGAA